MHNNNAQCSVVMRSKSSCRSDTAFLPSYHAIWIGKASASAPLAAYCSCKQQKIKSIGQGAHALLSLDTDKAGKHQWTPGKMRCSWWWTIACHVLHHSFNDARRLFGCSLPLLLVDGGGHDTQHIARPSILLGGFHLACCSVEFDGVSWVLRHGIFWVQFSSLCLN